MTRLDDTWFEQLLRITAPVDETFALLELPAEVLEEKRKEFEASCYTATVSLFPEISVAKKLDQPYEKLCRLRTEIDQKEKHPITRETYLAYIDDMLANIELIKAACRQDATEYARLNRELYGDPDREIYANICDWIRFDVETEIAHASESLISLGHEVLRRLPKANGDYRKIGPTAEVFHKVRDAHFRPGGFYEKLFGQDGFPVGPYVSQIEGDEICQRVLRAIGSDYEIVDSPNNTWAVSRDPRLLFRPLGYRLSVDEFVGIVGHEIGSHILESVNGAKQPLRLLEMGLAGYLKGNEGRALLREQIVYRDVSVALKQPAWEYNMMKHLSICLAIGYNDHPYTFSELYDALYHLYRFWRERSYPLETNNEAYAREQAWFLTVRILKGTDGSGGCYQKDSVYLEGNIKLWQMAAEDPEIILLGDEGKFNLLDDRQRELFAEITKLRK